jgi:hypothetical protein
MRDEVATVKSSALPAKLVDALFDVPGSWLLWRVRA